jgi:uncharacterized protein YndB with AHSA1/START domain
MATVEYERARGRREKHQTPEGFSISRSKTMAVSLPKLYKAWSDARLRARWLPEKGLAIRAATPNKSMRMTWKDGKSIVSINFYAKGENKSQVVVEHNKLADAAEARRMQDYWSGKLERLVKIL